MLICIADSEYFNIALKAYINAVSYIHLLLAFRHC